MPKPDIENTLNKEKKDSLVPGQSASSVSKATAALHRRPSGSVCSGTSHLPDSHSSRDGPCTLRSADFQADGRHEGAQHLKPEQGPSREETGSGAGSWGRPLSPGEQNCRRGGCRRQELSHTPGATGD